MIVTFMTVSNFTRNHMITVALPYRVSLMACDEVGLGEGLEVGDKFNITRPDVLLIGTPLLRDKDVAKLVLDTDFSNTLRKYSGVWPLLTVTVYATLTPDNNIRLFDVTVTPLTALTGTPNTADTLCLRASVNDVLDAWTREIPESV